MQAAPQAQPRPEGKVQQLGPSRFQPLLRYDRALLPLGDSHTSLEAAEAAYDVGKLLLVRRLHPLRPLEELKLHRPAAAYTAHPLWAELTSPDCSFEEACSLLAGGRAAGFLLQGPAAAAQLRAQQQQQRKAARRDSGSAEQQQEAASASAVLEDSAASSASEEEEEEGKEEEYEAEEMEVQEAGRKRRRHGQYSGSKWAGLGPDGAVVGSQGITMRLSNSDTGSSVWAFHTPELYVRALAGVGSSRQVPPTIELTAPDGGTHTCSLYQSGKMRQWFLGRVKQLLKSLRPLAGGDLLCFTPTGRGTASVALVRAAAPQASAQAASGQEGEGRSGTTAPAADAAAADVVADVMSKWQGLEPTDSRRYTAGLTAATIRNGHRSVPERYAVAAFGQAPEPGAGALKVTATSAADGSAHALSLTTYRGKLRFNRLSGLLASLGAVQGDSLCLEPAGPLAVRVSLVKASAAAAAGEEVAEEEAEGEAEEEAEEQQQEQQEQPSSTGMPTATAAGVSGSAAASLPSLPPWQCSCWLEPPRIIGPF